MLHRFPRARSALAWFGLIALAATLVAIPLVRYAKRWLATEIDFDHADVILVLGGESGQRVFGAVDLYRAGVAPRVFVSGSGDCTLIVHRLVMAGIPRDKIGYECQSNNTAENAEYSKMALAPLAPHRIMLVTSWYHSVRALNVFREVWPEVEWGVHCVHPGDTLHRYIGINEAGAVMSEYAKNLWYRVRYP